MESMKNNIYVLSGPSGVGKSTIAKKLLAGIDNLKKTISYTTRTKRTDEVDGEDYHFIDEIEFKRKIDNQEFIEWVQIYNNYYGTTFSSIKKMLSKSDLLMVIDMIGAKNIKNYHPENSVLTYILPPSLEELKNRLHHRANKTPEENPDKRFIAAKEEIKRLSQSKSFYDYTLVNDCKDECYKKIKSIIDVTWYKSGHEKELLKSLLNNSI